MGLKEAWQGLFSSSVTEKVQKQKETLSDDEKDINSAIKRMRQEHRLMREKQRLLEAKQELRDLQDELNEYNSNDDDNNNEDTQLMTILTPLLASLNKNNPPSPQVLNTPPLSIQGDGGNILQQNELTDDEIRDYLKKQPQTYIHISKGMPQKLLFRKIREQISLTDNECARIYKILMTEF